MWLALALAIVVLAAIGEDHRRRAWWRKEDPWTS
jgi:hypothetical protein